MRESSKIALGVLFFALAASSFAQQSVISYQQKFAIPAGDLAAAVDELAAAFHINILYKSNTLKGVVQNGLEGQWSYVEALHKLLQDTRVYAERVDEVTYVLKPIAAVSGQTHEKKEKLSTPHIDEVIVTGTRQKDRTLFESLSPVDVINTPMAVGSVEMIDSLAAQLPGFTAFRLPLSDGQIFNRTSGLRGLNSDHTLILVNGKRRHRSAFLETSDGQPTDLTHIPMYAVKRVEVLRDGASAMYGSDAIAGVINIILDQSSESAILLQSGQYYAGDGLTYSLNLKHGWGQADQSSGTLTLSGYSDSPTSML